MRVFISWSGEKSRMVAEALRDWLPDVVNAVDPWMSQEDIEKGAVGLAEIATELQGCSYGIVCLTRENQDRPWINYEAGALSKSVTDQKSRVATFLIDFDRPGQVTGPVSSFQATMPTLEDVTKLVVGIDQATGEPRERDRVVRLVAALWPVLEEKIAEAQKITEEGAAPEKRSPDDMLVEILEISRQTARAIFAEPNRMQLQELITANREHEEARLRRVNVEAVHHDIAKILELADITADYRLREGRQALLVDFDGQELPERLIEAMLEQAAQRGVSMRITGVGDMDYRNYGFQVGIGKVVRHPRAIMTRRQVKGQMDLAENVE